MVVVWLSGRRSRPSGGQAGGVATVTNINDVLDGHVSLDLDCVDRVYLNAYVPTLQVGGQVNRFLHDHLGQPVASPAVVEKIGNRFRREVKAFADDNGIPVLRLAKPDRTRWDDRKLDHVRPHLDRAERLSQFGWWRSLTPGQGVGQRARVGQASSRPRAPRLHRPGQRVRQLR